MRRRHCLFAFLAALSVSCSRIDAPQANGELVVAVRSAPAFYQDEGESSSGFEHDVIVMFARELGVAVRFVVARDPVELVALLHAGSIHFAATLPVGAALEGVRYAPPLLRARPVLVRHADSISLDDTDNLAREPVEVVAGSPLATTLKAADGNSGRVVMERAGIGDIDLLAKVAEGKIALAATDLLHFRLAANYFPDLRVAAQLPGEVEFAWGFARDGDDELFRQAAEFIERLQRDGTLARLDDRYFGHLKRLTQPDTADFLERMRTVLPHFRRQFQDAQEVTGIDWRLLAAVAYQESNWNPQATSPTGVRGIMMLTADTARQVGVTDLSDPRQSILAGAKYMADLMQELPGSVRTPDRLWLALAAYNLGMGHLNGARAIAANMKRNPDSWYEMKQVLPLLARPEYYARLKSGRARGGEAVIMVENVRSFFDIISRFEPPYTPTLSLR